MIIYLSKNRRIDAQDGNFTLQLRERRRETVKVKGGGEKPSKSAGQTYWRTFGHFTDLERLARRAVEEGINVEAPFTWQALIDLVEHGRAVLREACEGATGPRKASALEGDVLEGIEFETLLEVSHLPEEEQ